MPTPSSDPLVRYLERRRARARALARARARARVNLVEPQTTFPAGAESPLLPGFASENGAWQSEFPFRISPEGKNSGGIAETLDKNPFPSPPGGGCGFSQSVDGGEPCKCNGN